MKNFNILATHILILVNYLYHFKSNEHHTFLETIMKHLNS